MKKILLAAIVLNNYCYACVLVNDNTPERYRSTSVVSSEVYIKNKSTLADSIRSLILSKIDPYYQKENDSTTKLFIDTVLYSPDKHKVAFFAITQNENYKLPSKRADYQYHFEAHCFLGRAAPDSSFNIFWVEF